MRGSSGPEGATEAHGGPGCSHLSRSFTRLNDSDDTRVFTRVERRLASALRQLWERTVVAFALATAQTYSVWTLYVCDGLGIPTPDPSMAPLQITDA